jgi:hypothetical protein
MKVFALLLAAVFAVHPHAARAEPSRAAKSCLAASAKPVRDPRVLAAIALAREEHRVFGGQVIDRRGGIVRVGFHEAEFDRLPSETTPTWQRVAQFWAAVDEELPESFRSPAQRRVSRKLLMERITALKDANGLLPLDQKELDAMASSLLRSSLIDHPWSAAFISFVMKQSGFGNNEFKFSDTHADYVDEAFLASAAEAGRTPTDHAYRACDVLTTPPRPGDLICHTREGSAGIASYAALRKELELRRSASRSEAIAMHCDLVTRADEDGDSKIETIGGNVFQSVTLRQMTLNDAKTLGAKYLQSGPARRCMASEACGSNLSRKPWVVLLQFRR